MCRYITFRYTHTLATVSDTRGEKMKKREEKRLRYTSMLHTLWERKRTPILFAVHILRKGKEKVKGNGKGKRIPI